MPNYCDNIVTIKHEDKEAIDRVIKAFKKGKLCSEFIPIPKELQGTKSPSDDLSEEESARLIEKYGARNWYDFCVLNWGTKWDVGGDMDFIDNQETLNNGSSVQLTFTSAWSPPIGLYAKLMQLGYSVTAYYYEEGVGFCGKYTDNDDEYYNLSGDEVSGDIPYDIDDMFNITETYKMWREEEDEEFEKSTNR